MEDSHICFHVRVIVTWVPILGNLMRLAVPWVSLCFTCQDNNRGQPHSQWHWNQLAVKLEWILCFINRFTSLCKNLLNLLEFLAEAFRCHVHHFQCFAVPVECILSEASVTWLKLDKYLNIQNWKSFLRYTVNYHNNRSHNMLLYVSSLLSRDKTKLCKALWYCIIYL